MYATKKRRESGMVMILVLVLVALLLIVALAVITGSNNAAASATAVSIKYRVLNSAEGAANYALNDLAANPLEAPNTHLRGSLNGAAWDALILANNLTGGQTQVTDPATGLPVDVPAGHAYVYGVAAENGGHTTYIEAMIAPGPPLTLPPGVMNAANNILDLGPMAINADPADLKQDDADVHANNNILGHASAVVQGTTFAVNTDELEGQGGSVAPAAPVTFPTSTQISQAVRTASLTAQAGQQLTGDQITQSGSPQTYTGNVYINGNVVITGNTITLSNGHFVYVNGNLCIETGGRLNNSNAGTSEIVVAGNVEVANGGSYATNRSTGRPLIAASSARMAPDECPNSEAWPPTC